MSNLFLISLFITILSCSDSKPIQPEASIAVKQPATSVTKVSEIPLPAGFERISTTHNSFASWLRQLKFKKDKTVYLFNGTRKPNQEAQYAVLELSRSETDIQQCADVVMRLRAEYLFENRKFDSIRFMDFNKKWYHWTGNNDRKRFGNYLQTVFGWCGSASLEKQLKNKSFEDIEAGDVFIKGGFPGHAMIVADIAINKKGEKIFTLIQGYQPAQDIHLVINPSDPGLSPWYSITAGDEIVTPEWRFNRNQLYRW